MNFIFILGSLILAAFVAQNLLKSSIFDAAACAIMIIIAVIGFILARAGVNLIIPAFFSLTSYELFCFFLIWNGDAQGAGFLFIFIYPLLTIFLLGMKTGIYLSCSQLAVTAVQVFVPGTAKFNYHFDVSIRMVSVYILVLSITVVFEQTRQAKDNLNVKLTEELRIFNENLQKMVEEKTGSLLKLHDTFGRYLPDKVIKQLMDSPTGPSLWAEKRYITIMTSDIRGFTPLVEKHSSEIVIQLLNHYFSAMVEIINSYNGTIIEFLGDSILCIFGAPLDDDWHADKAVVCALKMQSAMKEVNTWNRENNFPDIEMGIAINTGEATVGNIGSDRVMKYNVIGNSVNLSSRIESYTTGGQVMISEYTHDALRSPVSVTQKIRVTPKGVSNPIYIMQIDAIGEPFYVSLDDDAVPLKRLEQPVRVLCFRVRNKHIDEQGFEALLTHLSRKEGKLSVTGGTGSFDIFEELKLRVFDRELMVKVSGIEDRDSVKIRFSADPGEFPGGI
ncbi:MAG: adenylate/guanylate cyclase domain-containing protein [Treponema sp.]|nr:adenylate/guanylate cyclase domain-containing protein [Treponema sp.]